MYSDLIFFLPSICFSLYIQTTRKQSFIIMKLSFASPVVSMTTAASMTAALDDAPLLQKDIVSDTAPSESAVGDTSSLLTGSHHRPNASTHVRESLPSSDDMQAAVASSTLLRNEEHTSGGGSKNVDVDVGLLPIFERRLDSATCNNWNRPVIKEDGTSFRLLIEGCITEEECPEYLDYENVPIGCWDTSDVTDMSSGFSGDNSDSDDFVIPNVFNKPINCWNVASVNNMRVMFYYATNFNQPTDDWDVCKSNYFQSTTR